MQLSGWDGKQLLLKSIVRASRLSTGKEHKERVVDKSSYIGSAACALSPMAAMHAFDVVRPVRIKQDGIFSLSPPRCLLTRCAVRARYDVRL